MYWIFVFVLNEIHDLINYFRKKVNANVFIGDFLVSDDELKYTGK